MIGYFLTPPGLYYLISFIIVVSLIVYWKREPIKKELRRWRAKEIDAGPVKLERQVEEKQGSKAHSAGGVDFGVGNDFTGAKIKGVAGRDIRRGGSASSPGGAIPGVSFGEKGKFGKAEIEDVAGRDLEQKEE